MGGRCDPTYFHIRLGTDLTTSVATVILFHGAFNYLEERYTHMPIVRTSAKGQVVIPKGIRRALGIKPGTRFQVLAEDEKVVLFPVPEDPIEAACGMLQGGPSLTKALLQDRKEDLAREEKKFARFVRHARVPQQRTRVRKG